MSNYVPKEKKPILTREKIKKDLGNGTLQTTQAILSFAAVIFTICMSVMTFYLMSQEHPGSYDFGVNMFGAIIALCFTALFVILFCYSARQAYIIKNGKFNILTDELKHKVEKERVRDFGGDRKFDNDKYRYPNVLYFVKYGRYELCFGRDDGVRRMVAFKNEMSANDKILFESAEMGDTFYIVTFSNKKAVPRLVYNAKDYDVQL